MSACHRHFPAPAARPAFPDRIIPAWRCNAGSGIHLGSYDNRAGYSRGDVSEIGKRCLNGAASVLAVVVAVWNAKLNRLYSPAGSLPRIIARKMTWLFITLASAKMRASKLKPTPFARASGTVARTACAVTRRGRWTFSAPRTSTRLTPKLSVLRPDINVSSSLVLQPPISWRDSRMPQRVVSG